MTTQSLEGTNLRQLSQREDFIDRHIGPSASEIQEMLATVGAALDAELGPVSDWNPPLVFFGVSPFPASARGVKTYFASPPQRVRVVRANAFAALPIWH